MTHAQQINLKDVHLYICKIFSFKICFLFFFNCLFSNKIDTGYTLDFERKCHISFLLFKKILITIKSLNVKNIYSQLYLHFLIDVSFQSVVHVLIAPPPFLELNLYRTCINSSFQRNDLTALSDVSV